MDIVYKCVKNGVWDNIYHLNMIISLTSINRVAVKCHISSKQHNFSIKKYKSFCKDCCLLPCIIYIKKRVLGLLYYCTCPALAPLVLLYYTIHTYNVPI